MAVLDIVKLGDPILQKVAGGVNGIDDRLKERVADMVETMYAAPGVGLAANQVGWDARVAVIDISVGETPGELIVLVNPEIVSLEGKEEAEEGCLSVPGFVDNVARPLKATVRAMNLDGVEYEITGEGLLARALMHEIDHLNGILFINHLSRLKRALIERKVNKLIKEGEWR